MSGRNALVVLHYQKQFNGINHLCNINLYVTIFHSLVAQSKQVSSICTASKALGNTMLTSLTSSEQAGTLNTAAAGAKIQAIIDAINSFAIPDC